MIFADRDRPIFAGKKVDGNGRIIQAIDDASRRTVFEYDDAAQSVKIIDHFGRVTLWMFDPNPRPIPVIDPQGAGLRMVRVTDSPAFSSTITNPRIMALENEYFRPRMIVDRRGCRTTYRYDAEEWKTSVEDANGRTVVYQDDSSLRMVTEFDVTTSNIIHVFRPIRTKWLHRYMFDWRI